ncbi:hypothetical protein [Streptomyces sp. NPDC057579]|uniref:hypothetical protein n=1 Tax=Streptomyces sp. NPDC057579 TaxID=3346172 RepID=UPI0036A92CA4
MPGPRAGTGRAKALGRSRFYGPRNYVAHFQTGEVHTALFPDGSVPKADVPALLIAARHDPICHRMLTDNVLQYFEEFERRMIDTGRWTRPEDPEGANTLLIDWLTRHF